MGTGRPKDALASSLSFAVNSSETFLPRKWEGTLGKTRIVTVLWPTLRTASEVFLGERGVLDQPIATLRELREMPPGPDVLGPHTSARWVVSNWLPRRKTEPPLLPTLPDVTEAARNREARGRERKQSCSSLGKV